VVEMSDKNWFTYKLTRLSDIVEGDYEELKELTRQVDELCDLVEKICKFLQAKFLEEWDSFEG
jgi:hypothetical protein